jgi:carboxyl-terminal processing protease
VRSTALLVLACSVLALAAGIYLGGHPDTLPGPIRDALVDEDRALRSQIVETIQDNFYKPVNESKLEDGSLNGIVESLEDPYSRYITPKQASDFQERVSGEFEGVGMSVEKDDRGLRVLNVFDGSPAAKARIHKQDLILSVDGRSIAGLSSDLATSRIKGPAGTKVELEVFTPGGADSRTVRVERERIHVPVATGRVVERDGHKIGVVRLTSFTNGAHGVLRRRVNKVLDDGAQAIVLDLRGNGGGLLTEAVLVSSIFIEDGKIVSVRGRERPERTDNAEGDAIDPDIPVAVLVDGGSASASEIVTGALRDRHRATVVGTNTFGKGLVQEVEPLSNGGYLDITVANYYLPGGDTISTRGLKPQVKAFDKPKTKRDEALPAALDVLAGKL